MTAVYTNFTLYKRCCRSIKTMSTYQQVIHPNRESTNQFAETPDDIMEALTHEFGDMFDPCPLLPTEDGLTIPWSTEKINYCNPPYDNIPLWLEKTLEERESGKTVVCLLPSRTGCNWFHDYIVEYSSEIRFIKQGIKFKGYKRKCPFPVMLAIFKPGEEYGNPTIKSVDFYAS